MNAVSKEPPIRNASRPLSCKAFRWVVLFVLLVARSAGFAAIAGPATTSTTEPPSSPILRIETGQHTALIWGISVDEKNRYLVTGSADKTARVWELASGRLLQTLRPPIGPGLEGAIYAVAISPDGNTIACGGWTQFHRGSERPSPEGFAIYIYSRATGELLQRITRLPNVIKRLAFSRNGEFLAAGLGSAGISVFRTVDWQLAGRDEACGAHAYGLDFDAAGNLASTSLDGFIHVHKVTSQGLQLLRKTPAPGGREPYDIRFSPDGSRLAVGYVDTVRIDVLKVADLTLDFSPDVSGANDTSPGLVAWSMDGAFLYAAGKWKSGNDMPIRRFSQGGRGPFLDLSTGVRDAIRRIQPLAASGLAFSSEEPAIFVLHGTGSPRTIATPPIADFRNIEAVLRLSADGSRIRFVFSRASSDASVFDLARRSLVPAKADDAQLSAPLTAVKDLAVTDYRHSPRPRLNGAPLPLTPDDLAHAFATAPDKKLIVVGTERYLHCFDRLGRERWKQHVPAVVWGINITADGRVAVAALADGTVRWYRMNDGQEILALLPHIDKNRWVLWTPSGYYDAGPGSEQLIGWHVNRGAAAAADWFPVSQFRSRFYRPDVLQKVLATLDEAEAARLANQESNRKQETAPAIVKILPPVVTILSPDDDTDFSSNTMTVRYAVRAPSDAPVTSVRVLIDGRLPATPRGVALVVDQRADSEVRSLTFEAPARDFQLSIMAENRHNQSVEARVRLRYIGASRLLLDDLRYRPKLYVLAIGISVYKLPALRLQYARRDAEEFVAAISAQKGGLYRDVEVKLLRDEEATRDRIVDGLQWLREQVTQHDMAMVFFSGHGVNDQDHIFQFLPVNAEVEFDRLRNRSSIAYTEVLNTLKNLICKKVFLFVDACHAGAVTGAMQRKGPMALDIMRLVHEAAAAGSGVITFAGSSGNQSSLEHPRWQNGAFTKALVEGLRGEASSDEQPVTVKMLDVYVSQRVKELTRGAQNPCTEIPVTITDFAIALKRPPNPAPAVRPVQ